MEGGEGIAVAGAGGHGAAGFGLFRAADVTMAEAQDAGKEYHSSPSSPSTSPTPSPPPPAAAGHGGEAAAATPTMWSLGGEKPGEAAAGDNGAMQMSGHHHSEHASLSSGRRRGRPKGSGRRQILATLDVAARIMSFSQKGPRSICILSANGTISNVALSQPGSSGSTFTYEGRFEILQLTGSFTMAEEGGRRRTGGLSVSLAGPDGRVVGGVVAGMLRAASPIQVIVGSFLPNSLKQHQRRMGLQQQPSATPALPAQMAPPPVLTAAMPISQAAPGTNGCHAPQVSSTHRQAHTGVEHSATTGVAMNLNSSSSTGFTMVGWPVSSQPMGHRPSPDINVCLTPQE
uniref:AT-hook motif nuclear-localized protein n=1 Tax=Oryza brachyantha TaxID=4533 RepID=G2XM97_ORYBR|nr:hypothetical_protein [Oryza brachyantha]